MGTRSSSRSSSQEDITIRCTSSEVIDDTLFSTFERRESKKSLDICIFSQTLGTTDNHRPASVVVQPGIFSSNSYFSAVKIVIISLVRP